MLYGRKRCGAFSNAVESILSAISHRDHSRKQGMSDPLTKWFLHLPVRRRQWNIRGGKSNADSN